MDKIYEDNGVFNFIYQLPQIFYSSVISALINVIMKMLSMSEKRILEIKKEKSLDMAQKKADNYDKVLTIQNYYKALIKCRKGVMWKGKP